MASTFWRRKDIGFKSHDNKQQEDGIHFVMQHNADKHRY